MRTWSRTLLALSLAATSALGCADTSTAPSSGPPEGYTGEGDRPANAELLMLATWMGSDVTRLLITHPEWVIGGYSWSPPAPGGVAGAPPLFGGPWRPALGLGDRVCSTQIHGSWSTDENGNGIPDSAAQFDTCDQVDTIGGRILQHRDSMVTVLFDSMPGAGQNWVAHTFVMMRFRGPEGFDSGWSRLADLHATLEGTEATTRQLNRTTVWGGYATAPDTVFHGARVQAVFSSQVPLGGLLSIPAGSLTLEGVIYRFTTDSLFGHADSVLHAVEFVTDSAIAFGTDCSWPVDGWLKGQTPAMPLTGHYLAHFHDCDPYPDLYWRE